MGLITSEDILARMRSMRDLNVPGSVDQTQPGWLDWGSLGQELPFMRGTVMDGNYIDPEALAQWMSQNGYSIGQEYGPNNADMRWLQNAAGEQIIAPRDYATNDRAGFLAGALGLGGMLGTSLLAGGAAGGAPAVAGADAMFTPVAGSGFGSLAPVLPEALPTIPAIGTVPPVFPIGGQSLLNPVPGSGYAPLPPVSGIDPAPTIEPLLPIQPSLTADPAIGPPAPTAPGPQWPTGAPDWLKSLDPNLMKFLLPLLGAGLTQIGGDDDGGGGYVDSGYRPQITRGGWQASVQPTPVSLLTPEVTIPRTGRFGLLGGK